MMAGIRCGSCGWLNEPGARMCGGCGRPLPARVPAGASGAHAYGGSGGFEDDDARTVADVPPMVAARGRSGRPAPDTPSPQWGAAPSWPSRRRGGGRRVLLGLLIALVALALAATGAWAAIVRPQVHQQIDGGVRTAITAMVATVNRQPLIPSTTETFTGAQVTQSLEQQLPAEIPLQNVRVGFSGGRISVTFTTGGFDGAVSTQFVARDGRLVAVATEVDGPMALVESGAEMEAALNDSLSGLRTDISVQKVSLDKDVMSVTVKGNVPGQ